MRQIFLLLACSFCSLLLFAQNRTISGRVQDESGAGLSGISIVVKGTSNGATTDRTGNFQLSVPPGSTLVISGIGYEGKEVAVGDQTSLTINLATSAQVMSEVVVTGTGVATERRKLSIDVASVSNKDLSKTALLSIDQALMGKVAGAQIQSTSGEPGSKATIILRGINSLGSTGPIILVDGVQVTDINGLDVANVDRVEVVKGPAGGMLYGAQGANGVIQIFTKKGAKNRKPVITVGTKVSFDKALLGKDKRLQARLHHFKTDAQGNILDQNGNPIAPGPTGTWPDPAELDFNTDFDLKNDKSYPANLPLYDHLKQAYQQATTSTSTIGISGGSDKTDYAFAFSYLNQENVLNNKFKRYNLSSNLGFDLFKGFSFRNATQTIIQEENLLSGTYNLSDRILNPDVLFLGTNNNRFELINAYPWMDFKATYPGTNLVVTHPRDENQLNVLSEPDWHQRTGKDFRILNNANVNYKLPRFVELDYKYGIEIWNSEFSDLYKNQLAAPQVSEAFWGASSKGSLRIDNVRSTYQNSLATLFFRTDFEKDFGSKLPIKTTTQVSYDWRKNKYNSSFAQGLDLPQYPPSNISSAAQKVSGDYNFEYVTFGYLVNQIFDYGTLFGFTAGFRSDYNSDFGDQKKAFTFPRGTAYLRLSDIFKSKVITDWKIRAAYGVAGIPPYQFGGYYLRQTTLGSIQLGNGTGLFLPQNAGNDSLVVQKVKEKEIGMDLSMRPFKGRWLSRINLSTSYWHKRNEDIIQNRSGAPSTGVQSTPYNLIDLEVKGVDASLDIDAFSAQHFTWQTGLRFGAFRSKVLSVADDKDFVNGVFVVKKGESVGNFYAVTALTSVDQTRPDKTRYIDPAQAGNYEIVNGMVVDKTTKRVVLTDPNDQSLVGNAYPKFTMSWNNNLSYRGINLSFQWDWSHGNSVYNLTRQWMYRDRLHKDFDVPVTIGGQTGAFVNYYNSLYNSVQRTGYFVEDASFIRLRDLTLSYQLNNLLKLKWVNNVTLMVSGRNLLTFTDYSGLDPEATTAQDSQGNATVGVGAFLGTDYFAIPNLRSYQVGINIQF